MGLKIVCDDSAPPPRPCRMMLTCDDAHGLFEETQVFDDVRGYVEQFAAAMRAGWKEAMGPGGPAFLCPTCSGKKIGV